MNISTQLKKYRQLNNMSQIEVANYLGIGPSTYHHYESGKREPGVEVLSKLAKLYRLEDQLLGVYKNIDINGETLKSYSFLQLHKNISSDGSKYTLNSNFENKEILLYPSQFDALCSYFQTYTENKKRLFKELASSKSTNEGKKYEALIYAWLEEQGLDFDQQIKIPSISCLKNNDYYADGIIENSVIFDVKMFGITHPNIERLQTKLNKMKKDVHKDFYITISGSIDISNSILQDLLTKAEDLYNELFLEKNRLFYNYMLKMADIGLNITAYYNPKINLIFNISEYNPYKWAKENQYYFFHDASQFCTDKPYIIICPYDKKIAKHFTNSFADFTMAAFRSLCRRMFMGMPDDIYAHEYDDNCSKYISLRTASRFISAIIFQDVSMQSSNDDTWIFVNPNAKNKAPRYIVDQFRFHMQSMYEDFAYDSY